MSAFTYSCPHCGEELGGSFGDNVYCKACDITFETECECSWDDDGEYCSAWLTGVEHKGKIDVDDQ